MTIIIQKHHLERSFTGYYNPAIELADRKHIVLIKAHKVLDKFMTVIVGMEFQELSIECSNHRMYYNLLRNLSKPQVATDDNLFDYNGNYDGAVPGSNTVAVGGCSMSQDSRHHRLLLDGDDDVVDVDCYDIMNYFGNNFTADSLDDAEDIGFGFVRIKATINTIDFH